MENFETILRAVLVFGFVLSVSAPILIAFYKAISQDSKQDQ